MIAWEDYMDIVTLHRQGLSERAIARKLGIHRINDHPDIREVFGGFEIRPVSLNYTVSKGKHTNGRELLVSNF